MEEIKRTMEMMKCHYEAVRMCKCFLLILRNPWDHVYIPKGLDKRHPTLEEGNVLKYLTY